MKKLTTYLVTMYFGLFSFTATAELSSNEIVCPLSGISGHYYGATRASAPGEADFLRVKGDVKKYSLPSLNWLGTIVLPTTIEYNVWENGGDAVYSNNFFTYEYSRFCTEMDHHRFLTQAHGGGSGGHWSSVYSPSVCADFNTSI